MHFKTIATLLAVAGLASAQNNSTNTTTEYKTGKATLKTGMCPSSSSHSYAVHSLAQGATISGERGRCYHSVCVRNGRSACQATTINRSAYRNTSRGMIPHALLSAHYAILNLITPPSPERHDTASVGSTLRFARVSFAASSPRLVGVDLDKCQSCLIITPPSVL